MKRSAQVLTEKLLPTQNTNPDRDSTDPAQADYHFQIVKVINFGYCGILLGASPAKTTSSDRE